MSGDLTAFLAARLDEDERRAKEALTPGVYRWVDIHPDLEWVFSQTEDGFAEALPKRILAEVAAKRAILQAYESQARSQYPNDVAVEELRDVLQTLASVYSDHPDYSPAWG